jgi:hypothetical protein
MTAVLIRREKTWTLAHRGECHVKSEAKDGLLHINRKPRRDEAGLFPEDFR